MAPFEYVPVYLPYEKFEERLFIRKYKPNTILSDLKLNYQYVIQAYTTHQSVNLFTANDLIIIIETRQLI